MNLTARSQEAIRILELRGRFDAHVAPQVKDWLERAETPFLVINLAGVLFIDSIALATLVSAMKRCHDRGGTLRLCGLQQPVRIIFELTRMDRAFALYDSEAAAIDAFAS